MFYNSQHNIIPGEASMKPERTKSFNYAVGMFGTSIPINLLKTFAAAFYIKNLGLSTERPSLSIRPTEPLAPKRSPRRRCMASRFCSASHSYR